MKANKLYNQLLHGIRQQGYRYVDETRVDTEMTQISSVKLSFPLTEFPLLTTKKVSFHNVKHELVWIIRGCNTLKYLLENNVGIWTKDAYNYYNRIREKYNLPELLKEEFIEKSLVEEETGIEDYPCFGYMGEIYGKLLRKKSIYTGDPLVNLVKNLRGKIPITRRHIINYWDNSAKVEDAALPPCHWSWEVIPRPITDSMRIDYSKKDKVYLDGLWASSMRGDKEAEQILKEELGTIPNKGFILKWRQRSVDTFLGLPYNIAHYACLAHVLGALTNMLPLDLEGDLSNVHIYSQHKEAIKEQMGNNVNRYQAPEFSLSREFYEDASEHYNNLNFFFDNFKSSYLQINNYNSYPAIKADMIPPKS